MAMGYGVFWVSGGINQNVRAHRLSYAFANNVELSRDIYVCHKCDNPGCVNPAHLFLGDARINAHDAMRKDRHGHGESHGMHVLTSDAVQHIRRIVASQTGKGGELARKFGVTRHTIFAIKKGLTWKSLPVENHCV